MSNPRKSVLEEVRTLYLQRLASEGFDIEGVQSFLDYAQYVTEKEIRDLRKVLEKANDQNLRCELLARIDSLQLVKSQFDVTQLAKDIEGLKKEGKKLNVLQ